MTDKKFTDEEIIKASECCLKDDYPNQCQDCPMDNTKCGNIMHKAVYEVMITQKAEIERLQEQNTEFYKTIKENAQTALEVTLEEIEKAKVEAIKEFAEKLCDKLVVTQFECGDYLYDVYDVNETLDTINNIKTEMVGEDTNEQRTN